MDQTTADDGSSDSNADDEHSDETAPSATGDDAPDGRADEPSGPEEKLLESLTEFKADLQDEVRPLVRAKKAAEQLCRDGALDNLELVRKYTDWLRRAELERLEMEDRRQKAVSALETFVDRRRRKRRHDFLHRLGRAADADDVEIEKLAENPFEVLLAPFVLEVDFESGETRLEYARSEVAETDLDPDAVVEARNRETERLHDAAVDSSTFFDRLHRAYEMARRRRDLEPGSRVDLVDLRAPLALMQSDVDRWRTDGGGELVEYPDHLYSYQLQALRRDGMLEEGEYRIDLGTATGGSTEDKDDVLFIPSGPTDGQYYLSIRFVE